MAYPWQIGQSFLDEPYQSAYPPADSRPETRRLVELDLYTAVFDHRPRRKLDIYCDGSVHLDGSSGCGVVAYSSTLGVWKGLSLGLGQPLLQQPHHQLVHKAEKCALAVAMLFVIQKCLSEFDDFTFLTDNKRVVGDGDRVGSGEMDWTSDSPDALDKNIGVMLATFEGNGKRVDTGYSKKDSCEGNRWADSLAGLASAQTREHGYVKFEFQQWFDLWPEDVAEGITLSRRQKGRSIAALTEVVQQRNANRLD